jgi:DNA-binding SARP family transcriptional activator
VALSRYRKARSLDNHDVEAARGIVSSLTKLGHDAEVVTELQRLIVDHPEDDELHLQLSQVYARLGKHEEAERARATFETLHARDLEKKASQRPRVFSP